MLTDNLTLTDLFVQLGLDSDPKSIESFINNNKILDQSIKIEDAPFWTSAQSNFLRVSLQEDAEWAELIDQLSALLR